MLGPHKIDTASTGRLRVRRFVAADALPLVVLVLTIALIGCGRAQPAPDRGDMVTASDGTRMPLAAATPVSTSSVAMDRPGSIPPFSTSVPDHIFPMPQAIEAKIEIVWPHAAAPVGDADRANVTAYLIPRDNTLLPCTWEPVVRLWAAQNARPALPIAIGQKRLIRESDGVFPVWDFNDVDVSAVRDSMNKLAFFVTVDGIKSYHNIWVHAGDARTIFPLPNIPTAVTTQVPEAVEARIQIVWPHGDLPVDQAHLANISVYLFDAASGAAFAPEMDWAPVVRLHTALNTQSERPGTTVIGTPRKASEGTMTFMAWDFNDVDVSAAQDSLNRIYFWVSVDGIQTFSNIWTHAIDARTIFPNTDTLPACR